MFQCSNTHKTLLLDPSLKITSIEYKFLGEKIIVVCLERLFLFILSHPKVKMALGNNSNATRLFNFSSEFLNKN